MSQQEKTIGANRYRVAMLDPESAEDCLIDILKMLGPTVAGVFANVKGKGIAGLKSLLEKKVESGEFIDIAVAFIRDFSSSFDKATYHAVCRKLADVTTVSLKGGKTWPKLADVQMELYRGNLQEKWAWLGFALQVNFAGFFEGISSAVAPVLEAVGRGASSSTSPQASDGASGES